MAASTSSEIRVQIALDNLAAVIIMRLIFEMRNFFDTFLYTFLRPPVNSFLTLFWRYLDESLQSFLQPLPYRKIGVDKDRIFS